MQYLPLNWESDKIFWPLIDSMLANCGHAKLVGLWCDIIFNHLTTHNEILTDLWSSQLNDDLYILMLITNVAGVQISQEMLHW